MINFSAQFHDEWMEVQEKATGCRWSFGIEDDGLGHTVVSGPITVAAKEKLPEASMADAACAFAQHEAEKAGLVDAGS